MSEETLTCLLNDGIYLVPTRARGEYIVPYGRWRETLPDPEVYLGIWSAHPNALPEVLCGIGGVCSIDIDEKNKAGAVALFETELRLCLPELYDKLYIEETASGGRHYFFTCPGMESEDCAMAAQEQDFEDLAAGKIRYRPFIEFKAKNSLCRTYPGDGIKIIQGTLLDMPAISRDDAMYIKYVASLLNEKPEQKKDLAVQTSNRSVTVDSPGQDYSDNSSVDHIVGVLERHGWAVVKGNGYRGRITFRRPGAKTKGVDADMLNRVFACRSSSVAEFEPHKGYSLFAVYAILEHKGNYSEAAKQLKAEGYGRTIQVGSIPTPSIAGERNFSETGDGVADDQDALWLKIEAARLALEDDSPDSWSIHFYDRSNKFRPREYGVMEHGLLCVIGGREKSRKTTILTAIIASMLSDGAERCGFQAKTWGNIVWFDTEQPRKYARKARQRILIQAGLDVCPQNLHFFPLKSFRGAAAKLAAARKCLEKVPDVSVIVVDGIVDLGESFNDEKSSRSLVDELSTWQEPDNGRERMVFAVIHMNKSDRELRGHIGTMLGQKADVVLHAVLNDSTNDTDMEFARARDIRPNAFSFSVIGDNIPYIMDYPQYKELQDIFAGIKANGVIPNQLESSFDYEPAGY